MKTIGSVLVGSALVAAFPALVGADWRQFQATGRSGGFNPVATSPARTPAWSLPVGRVDMASPVVGRDGTVYVANLDGEVIAVNTDGSVRWRRDLGRGAVYSTPAMASDGNLYLMYVVPGQIRDHRGDETIMADGYNFMSLDPNGNVRWTRPLPPLPDGQGNPIYPTTRSPIKAYNAGEHPWFFIVASYMSAYWPTCCGEAFLLAIDSTGIVRQTASIEAIPIDVQGGGFDGLPDILGWLEDLIDNQVGDPAQLPDKFEAQGGGASVVATPPDVGLPIIAASGGTRTRAFRWNGSQLDPIWTAKTGGSLPGFLPNQILATGGRGQYSFLNLLTGGPATSDAPLTPGSFGVPAGSPDAIFTVDRLGLVIASDNDGSEQARRDLFAECVSSPAVSKTHVYVNTAHGLHTFTHDLQNVTLYGFWYSGNRTGMSSPVVADSGSVYVIANDQLHAFSHTPDGDSGPPAVEPPPAELDKLAR